MTTWDQAIEAAARELCCKAGYNPDTINDRGYSAPWPYWKKHVGNARVAIRAALPIAAESIIARADAWARPDALRLAAGEMTAQELRTAIAVAKGIAAAQRSVVASLIENLKDPAP